MLDDVGLIEAISFIGRFLGTLTLILVRVKRQKLTYTMFGFLHIVGNGIIASAHFFPDESKLCFLSGMIIIGFSRGAYSTPFILMS